PGEQLLRGDSPRADFPHDLHHQGDFAELEDVARSERLFRVAEADAVEERAVGAAEIAHLPVPVAEVYFGVSAADRAVVEDDFQCAEAAGPEHLICFPDLPLKIASDASETVALIHVPRTPRQLPVVRTAH